MLRWSAVLLGYVQACATLGEQSLLQMAFTTSQLPISRQSSFILDVYRVQHSAYTNLLQYVETTGKLTNLLHFPAEKTMDYSQGF